MVNKKELLYKNEKFELVFNLNVMEKVQDQYGSIEKWWELIAEEDEPKAKDIKFGFTHMINEGIDIYNEEHVNDEGFEPKPFLTEKQVGRIISEIGLIEAAKQLNETVIESTKSEEKN